MTDGISLDVPPSGSGCADCDAAVPTDWLDHVHH
jgi:hypothetical protein